MGMWILAAGLLMALGLAVRRTLQKRTRTRPKIQLGSESAPAYTVSADHEPASELQARMAALGESDRVTSAESGSPALTPRLEPVGGRGGQSNGETAAPRTGTQEGQKRTAAATHHSTDAEQNRSEGSPDSERISTWQHRRLFSSFQGILNEGGTFLRTPQPEELPIAESDYVFGSITPDLAQMLPETEARRELQRRNLMAAGYRSRAAWLNLTAVRFVLAFVSIVVLGGLLLVAPESLEILVVSLVVAVPLLVWALPPLLVAVKASERKIDIEHGLPDVLDMMNMGVSQGLTVPQSIRRIATEIKPVHPALAEELTIVNRQAEVGSLTQALKNFSARIDTPEVNSFTSLLMQSESTGTSISQALTDYSDSFRSSLKERADSRANAAAFKLLFPVSLCLMPSVFLFLLGPAIVELSDFFGNRVETLNTDRDTALNTLQQQPQLDLRRFSQNGQGGI